MGVQQVDTYDEFKKIIKSGKLVVVDFFANWCGPCKRMSPLFEELADQNPETLFISVDVDVNQETSEAESITALPTFRLYRDGEMLSESVGSNRDNLRLLVKQTDL